MLKLGIVIPSKNASLTIEDTLRSIVGQSGKQPIDIHVQDAGSSDGTQEIVERWSEALRRDSRLSISLHSSVDAGPAMALNKGFQRVDGDILTWLGSDDLLLPWCTQTVSRALSANKISWLTGLATQCDQYGVPIPLRPRGGLARLPTGFARPNLARGWHGPFSGFVQQEGTFWSRELWLQAGGFINEEFELAFDLELWARFARYAALVQIGLPLATFRVRPGQLSANRSKYRKEARKLARMYPKVTTANYRTGAVHARRTVLWRTGPDWRTSKHSGPPYVLTKTIERIVSRLERLRR